MKRNWRTQVKQQNAKRPRLSVKSTSIKDELGLGEDTQESRAAYLTLRKEITRLASGHIDLTTTYKVHEKNDPVVLMKVEHLIHSTLHPKYPKLNRILISRLLMDICQTKSRNTSLSSSLQDAELTVHQYQTILDRYPHLTKKDICDKVTSGEIPKPLTRTEARLQGTDVWGEELPDDVKKQLNKKKERKKNGRRPAKKALEMVSDEEDEDELDEEEAALYTATLVKKRTRPTAQKNPEIQSPSKKARITREPSETREPEHEDVHSPCSRTSDMVDSPFPDNLTETEPVFPKIPLNTEISTKSSTPSDSIEPRQPQDTDLSMAKHESATAAPVKAVLTSEKKMNISTSRPLTVHVMRVPTTSSMYEGDEMSPPRVWIPAKFTATLDTFRQFLVNMDLIKDIDHADDGQLEVIEYKPYHQLSNSACSPSILSSQDEYETMIE